MKDFNIKLLDLKEEDLESIDSITHFNNADFIITLKLKAHVCPNCCCLTTTVKDYKTRKIKHKVLVNYSTTIFYKQRRYKCKDCGKTFVELSPFSCNRHVMTSTTVINILNDLKPYNSTYSSVAKKYDVSVSTVIDIFDKHVQIPRKQLTRILCMDEFYFDRHAKKKYAFMLMDFEKKYIIDIVESRWSEDLVDYFFHIPAKEKDNVQYVIIDMYRTYKDLSLTYLKNATICVDPFHAVKKVNECLNNIRKRIMRLYADDKDSQTYKLLKSRYYYILKNRDDLDFENYELDYIFRAHVTDLFICDEILKIHPDLKTAYYIKEEYIAFNNEDLSSFPGRKEKEAELDSLIRKMMISNIKEMKECAKTLKNWKQEILNSFHWIDDRRLSNGPIEGKNNYIKKIISNANGLSNFKRARNKFMYSQNYYDTYTVSEHQTKIKRLGNPRGKYKKHKK